MAQFKHMPAVRLATVTGEHLHVFHRWFHESRPETQTCRPVSRKSVEEVIRLYHESIALQNDARDFAVVRVPDDTLIGRVRYFSLNPRNRSAEIGYVIGPEFQNQGFATGAMALLLEHLFGEMSLNKVYAQTGEFNQPSISLLKRWGFHLDGRLRQHHELDGILYDDLIFSLLAAEYQRIASVS